MCIPISLLYLHYLSLMYLFITICLSFYYLSGHIKSYDTCKTSASNKSNTEMVKMPELKVHTLIKVFF